MKRYLLLLMTPDRSFPSHKMFIEGTTEGKEGRAALFRVLAVYAMYNPQVSYCQGNLVNFLCGCTDTNVIRILFLLTISIHYQADR